MQQLQEVAEDDVKIHLACKNIFLSLSLGFYLKGHLSTIDKADFIITDSVVAKDKFSQIPICVIGSDLRIPCSVYEMFSQLHEFYSHVNARQAQIFQKDMHTMQQNELKHNKNMHKLQEASSKTQKQNEENSEVAMQNEAAIIETIKKQKMQEPKMQDIMKHANPALTQQIELLFNELSQRIYDKIKNSNKS